MSAVAPANSANRNTGSVVAACTPATNTGDGDSSVISQPAPTSFIQVPILETTVATQSTANGLWANGAHARSAPPEFGAAGAVTTARACSNGET